MKNLLEYNQFFLEKEDKFADYPKAASKNAKQAIEWKEKYGRDEVQGGTAVGWQRAHQLAKGEAVSRDVVGRMAAFNRHRKNSKVSAEHKDTPWKDNGYIAWLIWGGDEGVDWAIKKMDQLEESVNEKKDQTNDQSPIDGEGIETGLKKKAKETGVPIGLLRIIMRRGMAAWKSGHRPGTNQTQWGYARVNSFLTKGDGTWGKADADIAKKVRDGGHDKKL